MKCDRNPGADKGGEPDEYRQGFVDFLGCKIDLSRRVLIPRPESEYWTERAIADIEKIDSPRVLDIFSGSGCVGIAVAKKVPQAAVDFCDIDANAIEQIKINLKINGIENRRAKAVASDIFENLTNIKYDVILANPPYIDPARIGEVQDSVLDYEPHVALFGGKGGMEIIEKFLAAAKNHLKPRGIIYLEFDPSQIDGLKKMIAGEGYFTFNFSKDQYGAWRFVKIVN